MSSIEEILQCNEFALALLMPEREFRKQVELNTNEDGTINTKRIAEYFQVSISDASLRGRNLGLFEKHFYE